ncbi:MAG: hypothetical protein J5805_03180, partial [Bacteroidaceae bacterium]|nr:hypothetical protein [Bacteroidaceae bacterium]
YRTSAKAWYVCWNGDIVNNLQNLFLRIVRENRHSVYVDSPDHSIVKFIEKFGGKIYKKTKKVKR